MKLQHLLNERCSDCSSRVISESQRTQHTNGQWFEYQVFECGKIVEWVPNFSESRIQNPCPKNKQFKDQKQKNYTFLSALLDLAENEKYKPDDKTRRDVIRELKRWKENFQ